MYRHGLCIRTVVDFTSTRPAALWRGFVEEAVAVHRLVVVVNCFGWEGCLRFLYWLFRRVRSLFCELYFALRHYNVIETKGIRRLRG